MRTAIPSAGLGIACAAALAAGGFAAADPPGAAAVRYPPAVAGTGAAVYATGGSPEGAAVLDANGDGVLDIAVADAAGGVARVLAGLGGGLFGPGPVAGGLAGARAPAAGDLNRDGRADLAVAGDGLWTMLGGAGGLAPAGPQGPAGPPVPGATVRDLVLVDLNGDGALDAAIGFDTGAPVIRMGDGAGGFGAATGGGPAGGFADPNLGLAAGDVNSDGQADLATVLHDGTAKLLLGDGAGRFTLRTVGVGRRPSSFALADVDGDGKLDLLVAESDMAAPASVTILRGDGAAQFTTFSRADAPPGVSRIAVADVDGDGRGDIIARGASGVLTVSLSRGHGRFGIPLPLPSAGAGTTWSAATDVTGDARADVILLSRAAGTTAVVRSVPPGVRATCLRRAPAGRRVLRCTVWRTPAFAGAPVTLRLRRYAPGLPSVTLGRLVPGGRTSTTLTSARPIPAGRYLLTTTARTPSGTRNVRQEVDLP
jgi:hypothetical protein